MLGLLEILRDEHAAIGDDENRIIAALEQSAKGLGHLLNDLLDLAKLKSGNVGLNPSWFNLHQMLENLVTGFEKDADKKGIDVWLENDEKRSCKREL